MIFTIFVVAFFVFTAPGLTWLSIPICLIYLAIKSYLKGDNSKDKGKGKDKNTYDEFDWWQDNQGL